MTGRVAGVVVGLAACTGLSAQMHKVAKPETVVRAVGVYEWTGDLAKPAASRLIPVTVYIDKKLEDAGVYLSRPVPFALQTGDVYELEEAGVLKGTFELGYARKLQGATVAEAYDDGWFGYGTFRPLPVPKKTVARKVEAARTVGIETASGRSADPDRPHFTDKAGNPVTPGARKEASGTAAGGAASAGSDDPDRPHLTRKDETDASPGKSDGSGGAVDADRPTMKRHDASADNAAKGNGAGDTPVPEDDADRPTLRRRAPTDKKAKEPEASVSGTGTSLNDDPDRPNLHRGNTASTGVEAQKLVGLPGDLRQMVAVSDAANRPVHDFARPWEDAEEKAAVLAKMRVLAQERLAAYGAGAGAAAPVVASAAAQSTGRVSMTNSKLRRPVHPVQVAVPLVEEQVNGYLLSYGDVPTFVYQAHTEGTGAALRYVTLVAQRDAQGEPKIVLQTVTDGAHLDRAARLRLVDAVDVEASNRASLLFEMRGEHTRQFAVYRVLGLQAEQVFSTGTMQ